VGNTSLSEEGGQNEQGLEVCPSSKRGSTWNLPTCTEW